MSLSPGILLDKKTYQVYLFCVFVFGLQKCRFERLEVHQNCIYSKKSTFWCQKCTNPPGIDELDFNSFNFLILLLSICRFGDFSLSKLLIFWLYAGFVHFWHQNVDLFWVCAGLVNLKSLKPAHTQKNKSFGSEKSPNLPMLKKNQKKKTISESMWDWLA